MRKGVLKTSPQQAQKGPQSMECIQKEEEREKKKKKERDGWFYDVLLVWRIRKISNFMSSLYTRGKAKPK